MKTKIKLLSCSIILLFSYSVLPAKAYRIEISNRTAANIPVFLAGYYGEEIFVVDSVTTDTEGKAVFESEYELCVGMYTIVAPGIMKYDFLLDSEQQLQIEWLSAEEVRITGNEPSGAFHAAYQKALQPVKPTELETSEDIGQMMREYLYRRRHFFDNMPLSDVRLLRTPLYEETVNYFLKQFVIQHSDSLIYIAYDMLEQASENYETFFYVSDLIMNYSLRNRIENINRLYNFIQRNRDMLGTKGRAMLPKRTGANYFAIRNEEALQARLENMSMIDIEGEIFNPKSIDAKYRIFFFWKDDCSRCIIEALRWHTILKNYGNKGCRGIAVNIKNDVLQAENRIFAYDPLCVNVSISNMPACETFFFASSYPKIIATDMAGNIIALFASTASLESFLKTAKL